MVIIIFTIKSIMTTKFFRINTAATAKVIFPIENAKATPMMKNITLIIFPAIGEIPMKILMITDMILKLITNRVMIASVMKVKSTIAAKTTPIQTDIRLSIELYIFFEFMNKFVLNCVIHIYILCPYGRLYYTPPKCLECKF